MERLSGFSRGTSRPEDVTCRKCADHINERATVPLPEGTKYRIVRALLPADIDRDGYDTFLAAEAMAESFDPDGDWAIVAYMPK